MLLLIVLSKFLGKTCNRQIETSIFHCTLFDGGLLASHSYQSVVRCSPSVSYMHVLVDLVLTGLQTLHLVPLGAQICVAQKRIFSSVFEAVAELTQASTTKVYN